MALKHLEEVIKEAGLAEDEVKKLIELPDDAKDFVAGTHATAIRNNVADGLKNDPEFYKGLNVDNMPKEFVKSIESAQYGRAATIVRTNMLKGAGLTEADFKELGEDGKKIEVFTPAFMKKVTEGKVTDKQLQEALAAANIELEGLKGSMPELENKYKTQYETKINAFEVKSGVLTTLASIPGLKVSPKLLLSNTLEELQAKYDLTIINGSVVIRQQGKPEMKVMVDNNTKELTLERAITELLTSSEAIDLKAAKKKTDIVNGQTIIDTDNQGGLKITNDKVKRRLEQEAKELSAGK